MEFDFSLMLEYLTEALTVSRWAQKLFPKLGQRLGHLMVVVKGSYLVLQASLMALGMALRMVLMLVFLIVVLMVELLIQLTVLPMVLLMAL